MNLDKVKRTSQKYILPILLFMLFVLLTGYYVYREEILRRFVQQRLTQSSGVKRNFEPEVKSSKKMLVVDIEGAVINPGVYEVEEDNRINDVIIAAGGFSQEVNVSNVNQTINKAQKIIDGMKLYIPNVNDKPTETYGLETNQEVDSGKDGALINVNTATKSELDTLPGVGSVTADKIISSRPYNDISELITKKVLSSSQYEKIKDLVSL